MTAIASPQDTHTSDLLPHDQTELAHLHRRLHGVAKAIVKRDDLADDAVQHVLIRLFRDGAGFDERRGSFDTWTSFLTRRAAIDVLRAETRQRRNESLGHHVAATVESPEDVLDRRTTIEAAHTLLDTLPADQRIVVEATYLGERSNREIARELDLPLGTVKSRIRRGMQKVVDLTASDPAVDVPLAL